MLKRRKVCFSLSLKELHSQQSVHKQGLCYKQSSAQASQVLSQVPTVMDSGRIQVILIISN